MSYDFKIDGLFDALMTNDHKKAESFAKDAKMELELLENLEKREQFTKPVQEAMRLLKIMIDNVVKGNINSAMKQAENQNMKNGYQNHLKGCLKMEKYKLRENNLHDDQGPNFTESQLKSRQPDGQRHKLEENTQSRQPHAQSQVLEETRNTLGVEQRQQESQPTNTGNEPSNVQTIPTYPDHTKPSVNKREADSLERNKKVSKAVNLNNPDIADLSDTNRPTKLAEKFSELYDNEWTEVFDILNTKKNVKEEIIIEELLLIVQDAYAFCQKEADIQIQAMCFECLKIIGGNKDTEVTKPSTSLIKEFRKANAALALPRLQQKFFDERIKFINKKPKGFPQPSKEGHMAKYAKKAIEVTWWMNVQDPPVYMCPTNEKFDPNLYRAYTKSGKEPVYFVWPALRLYQGGGVLIKGVVQFK